MTTIHVDLDDSLLRRTNAVLSEQRLSISDAIRQWLACVADRVSLPVESGEPNKTTIDAMRERDEDLPSFASTDALMEYLHEGR